MESILTFYGIDLACLLSIHRLREGPDKTKEENHGERD